MLKNPLSDTGDGAMNVSRGTTVENAVPAGAQHDCFKSFAQLSFHYREGVHFDVSAVNRGSRIGVFAPHGGYVEPGTAELAELVAGRDCSHYIFRALLEGPSQKMHLTSTRFDDPRALALARTVDTIVTIHGCADKEPFICFGGLDTENKAIAEEHIRHAGFLVVPPPRPSLLGVNPMNVCNRGRSGRGIQIEISAALRDQMRTNGELSNRFSTALRTALKLPFPTRQ